MRLRVLALLLFVTATAHAADLLLERVGDSAVALKKGEYAKALKIDEGVIKDMIARLGPGDAETKWFAVVVTHKALALAGLGREEDAIWYWHVALNLYPVIEQTDMSMYGAPAAFLKQHPFTAQFPTLSELRSAAPLPANVQPPKVVKRVEPVYPNGAMAFGVSGIVIVECVIDKSGVLRDIHMKKGLPAATLSYTTMEALRRWSFEPATVDGKPVDVLFNLTVNFKLR